MSKKSKKHHLKKYIGRKKRNSKPITIVNKKGNIMYNQNDCWETEIDIVKECGKAPSEIRVNFKPIVRKKIDLLMDKYKSREWLGYLIGEGFNIHDLIIPDQTATGASVDDVHYSFPEGIKVIGVIHSHHSMGHNFSSKDDEWINQNHDISVLVSHNGIAIQCRWLSPCGAKKIVPGKVYIDYDVNLDENAFLTDANDKIKAPVYVPYQVTNYQHNWYDTDTDIENETEEVFPSLREALADI